MIARRQGWIRSEHGDTVVLTHRRGATHGVIRYRERVRPLRTFDDQLGDLLAINALGFVVVGAAYTFSTDEGERAAIARMTATIDGGPVAFVLASVMAEDFFATLWGHAALPHADELAATIRELAQATRLALGVRRRALPHVAPAGWSARPAGLATDYVTPAGDAALRVLPAEPASGVDPIAAVLGATELDGRGIDHLEGPFDLPARDGAFACGWQFIAGGVVCDVVTIRDAHYDYTIVLEGRDRAAADRYRAALYALVASLQVFAPQTHQHGNGAFSHWAA
jgi:hypothetical protein